MTGTKTRLGLLALFLVTIVGGAQTMAFLTDEEQAVLRFAGNAAGNAGAGEADTEWGAGNEATSLHGSLLPPAPPSSGEGLPDAPPPATMILAPAVVVVGSRPGDEKADQVNGSPMAGADPEAGTVATADRPPPVPPPSVD